MDARKALTLPEPLLSAVQAVDEQTQRAATTYIDKLATGARAGLAQLTGTDEKL
jgi:hypothetical protein